jgi:hypothetical protein
VEPSKYRKKPVEIEAIQFTGQETGRAIMMWSRDQASITYGSGRVTEEAAPDEWLSIETMEGTMRADVGDWIIRGVKGEFYPCKPSIFAATYEAV